MTTPGQLALTIALGEVGVREDPPGSNRGRRVDQYLRAAGLDPERGSYPWCAAFVTWVMLQVELRLHELLFRGSASVFKLANRNRSLALPAGAIPWPGDIFLHFGPFGNHCGLVSQPATAGGALVGIATIEGNTDKGGSRTGGQVMHQNRPAGYAAAYLRPA